MRVAFPEDLLPPSDGIFVEQIHARQALRRLHATRRQHRRCDVDRTGQGIVAFVILRAGAENGPDLVKELRDHVAHEIGPIAKPRQILVVAELPKTRSGKIMRRLLRDVAENRDIGDATTLADPAVMKLIASGLSQGSSAD